MELLIQGTSSSSSSSSVVYGVGLNKHKLEMEAVTDAVGKNYVINKLVPRGLSIMRFAGSFVFGLLSGDLSACAG